MVKKYEQNRLIKEMHEGPGGGHFGVSRIQNKLCGKYFWHKMVEDVKYYVKTCKRCQRMNISSLLKPKLSLKPIPVPSKIFAQIGMDLIHMNRCRGYNYIITAVDYLSKYCEMRPLKEKSAREVARFIYEDLICRWGCSEYHITDQGREFVNSTNKELLDLCGTKQRITSAYHPQANGLSERMNRSTQESLRKSLENEHEFDWVDMIPTIAFSHRSSMNASTRLSPLEMILGHKPNVPIDIYMKYPTEEDLDRDLTKEEVARLEREYLDTRIEEMKKVKETTIGRAKVNIANAQIRQKRNYDKRFESKENFEIGDLVLLENQVNKNRKGGKRQNRFSGPYTILDISKAGNCTLKHKDGAEKKTKHPLAHLKQYNERNLVVESEIEVEENKEDRSEVDNILECFEKEECLEFVETLETEDNIEKKLQKKGKMDSNWNFAENVMGLVIKDKFKRKRKQNDSSVKKRKVTYLDLSKCVATDEDTLPDINAEEFSGAQRKEEYVGDERSGFTGELVTGARITGALNRENCSFTGAHIFTGAQNEPHVTVVTGAQDDADGTSVTGAQEKKISVTGNTVTGAHDEEEESIKFTGAPFELTGAPWRDLKKTPDRICKARRRLSLSLRKNRVPENSVYGDNEEKLTEYIIVDSSPSPPKSPSQTPSVEVLSDADEPGLPIPSRYVFIPIGTKIRRRLAHIFGINQLGPLPNYSGILKLCEGLPSRVKDIEGNGNCLFNSMSYVLSSSEKFNWKIRQKLCDHIEENWKKVARLGGILNKYKCGKEYLEEKKMRVDKKWGGSIEMCALACLTGYDVVTYYGGAYYKFGKNQSEACFFFYNPGRHYDVILEP